jgi:hypothetical protein
VAAGCAKKIMLNQDPGAFCLQVESPEGQQNAPESKA